MPYRRLPNTDNARIKALKTAIEKADDTDFKELSITPHLLAEAKRVSAQFERLCKKYQQMFDTQVKANRSFLTKVKNARMYVSHFVQVLYMAVIRKEIKERFLTLYGLDTTEMIVPELTSNEQLLEWGQKIIEGEDARISQGGVPIYNPSIAKVKVIFSLFREGYQTQKLHQKATTRVLNDVTRYRSVVDEVIFAIWEEVERDHMDLPGPQRLERNRQYGVVYYYRKGERVE